jgi:hypothetical protein
VVELVTVLAVLVVVGVLAAVVVRRIVRRYRRGVAHLRSRVLAGRRGLIPLIPPGPRRDAAMLRRRLASELNSTGDVIKSGPDGLIFRADASDVLHEVTASASALDTELAVIERFPDPDQQRAALAMVSPQVRQLIDTMYTARSTVLRTAVEDRERQLAALQANLDEQAAALEVYRRNAGELSI